jgi:hypothetical protein
MAVLMTADVPGQTPEGYDGMLAALEEPLLAAPGFIAHMAGPDGDSWRVTEIWESVQDATRFYATYVDPQLPPGVKPRRRFQQLHSLVRAPSATPSR